MNTPEEEVCSNLSIGSSPSRQIDQEQDNEREHEREHERELELHQSPSQCPTQSPEANAQNRKETPIRVRDMINLYNFATQKNQELEQAKTIYFGSRSEAELEGCDNPTSQDAKEIQGNAHGGTSLRQSVNEENPNSNISVEKSYQSKTTIRRTDQGVRIIIDIFFDKKDSDIDIVGSRVETDIPESRILTDFQQHSLAMQNERQEQAEQENLQPSAPVQST
ncbi:hypothetical protein KR009_010277 [Drosophila setifemur]|nr:hypothetical protein KR009_010277 [Drosophila setifemur]